MESAIKIVMSMALALGGDAPASPAPTRCGCGPECACPGVQGGTCDCAAPKARPPRIKSCPCSPACECGCNEGAACHCNDPAPRRGAGTAVLGTTGGVLFRPPPVRMPAYHNAPAFRAAPVQYAPPRPAAPAPARVYSRPAVAPGGC